MTTEPTPGMALQRHRRAGRPENRDRRCRLPPSTQNEPRRVVATVERHPGELYPRVSLIVTNLAVRLQLHALAYLGNFMRTLAMPKSVEP